MRLKPIALISLPALSVLLLWSQLVLPATAQPVGQPSAADFKIPDGMQPTWQQRNQVISTPGAPNPPVSEMLLGEFKACLDKICASAPPPTGLEFSRSSLRNGRNIGAIAIAGDIPQLTSTWFVSSATPPAPGLRVVIRNVTAGMKGSTVPYSDREYNSGSNSEPLNVTLADSHDGRYLAVLSGINDLTYEIRRGNTAIESGTFTVAITPKMIAATPPVAQDFSQPAFAQPPVLSIFELAASEQAYRNAEHDLIQQYPDVDPATLRSIVDFRRNLDQQLAPYGGSPSTHDQRFLNQQLQQDVELFRQLNIINH